MTTVEVPQVTSGPTPALRLKDPATQGLVGSIVVAAASTLWTSTGHAGLPANLQIDLNSLVGLYATVVVGLKHFLAGKFATNAIGEAKQAIAVAETVPAVKEAVDQVVAAVEATPPAEDPILAKAKADLANAQAVVTALTAPKGN